MAEVLPGYDLVIATRNRGAALARALPTMLGQAMLPRRLIVIDASQDHEAIVGVLAGALAAAGHRRPAVGRVEVTVRHTAPGLARQRNLGLAFARAEVVVLPGEDALLYPDAVERMLELYARDREGRIAGVCAVPADRPPRGAGPGPEGAAAPARPGPGRAAGALARRLAAASPLAQPLAHVGCRLNGRHPRPGWLAAEGAAPVACAGGAGLSFRRAAIAAAGFDEGLGDDGLLADADAGFAAMARGLVVAAGRARIHRPCPADAGAGGAEPALRPVLDRAYVAMKHVHANPGLFPDPGREAWRLRLHLLGLLGAGLARAGTAQGRARLAGALAGHRRLGALLAAAPGELAACHARLCGGERTAPR